MNTTYERFVTVLDDCLNDVDYHLFSESGQLLLSKNNRSYIGDVEKGLLEIVLTAENGFHYLFNGKEHYNTIYLRKIRCILLLIFPELTSEKAGLKKSIIDTQLCIELSKLICELDNKEQQIKELETENQISEFHIQLEFMENEISRKKSKRKTG